MGLHIPKNYLDLYLISYTKINFKMTIDKNLNPKYIKYIEENKKKVATKYVIYNIKNTNYLKN